MIFLSVLSEALAFLAVGLVSRWGEVVPRWGPLLAAATVAYCLRRRQRPSPTALTTP